MDERDLVGLLYRVDWTRLSLTGTVRGAGWSPNTTFTHRWQAWETGPRSRQFPLPDPPHWIAESSSEPPGAERSLILAPGRRYRLTSGSRVLGCDGERAWQWFTDLPADTEVMFDRRPELPIPELLAPIWLLLGYRLTIGEATTVAGRAGIAVTGVARTGPSWGLLGTTLLPWGLVPRPERVAAVIDAEFGIVLRRALWSGDSDEDADVAEFLSVDAGGSADPAVFAAPAGSFFGDGPSGERGSDGSRADQVGLAALKLVGGLAAGGLGAAIKYGPKRPVDPFAAATAEDPDDAMPDDEALPGWAAGGSDGADGSDGAGGSDGADGADGRTPVSDEVLELLYRGGLEPVPFRGTLHEWTDGEAVADVMLRAVPESARQVGFGGVGFLVDTILADERDVGHPEHAVYQVRVGAWNRYRVDRVRRAPATAGRRRLRRHDVDALTVACDGERTYKVFADEVRVGPASTLDEGRHGDQLQLLDASWLLMHRLSGGEVVEVEGRPAYRLIATAGPGPAMGPPLSWLPAWWLPAVAVVDASSGRLLRLTRYRDGKAVTRLELRSVSDGGSDDFGFTPPEGLRIVNEPERRSSRESDDDDHETQFFGPEDLRGAAGAFKEQLDAKIWAARGFLGSFLGGRD